MLRGALAAAVTPLDGDRLDEPAFGPYVDFLAASGLDGLLALGTTGEGLLFGVEERKRALELFLSAADGRLQVAAHCGAQTTADTLVLASHAAEAGVDAVAVIGPPYFQLDERSLLDHFEAAAARVRAAPVLRLRVRARQRLRGPGRRAARAARAGAEPRRASRSPTRPSTSSPRISSRASTSSSGRRRSSSTGSGRVRSAPSPGSRPRSRTRSPRSCESRARPARSSSASCARRSSASRATPR